MGLPLTSLLQGHIKMLLR